MLFHRTLSKVTDSLSVSTEVGRSDMGLEQLEPRRLLSSYVVDTTVDESDGDYSAGDLSLREAIELANADAAEDTITFSTVAFSGGGTITLGGSPLRIEQDLIIAGSNDQMITIDADERNGVIRIDNGSTVTMSHLSITGGNSTNPGGGINIRESSTLNLISSKVVDNRTTYSGGGIFVNGESVVNIEDSLIQGNFAEGDGGGVRTDNGSIVSITQSLLQSNEARNGGAMRVTSGSLAISDSTVSNNISMNQGGGIEIRSATSTLENITVNGNVSGKSGAGVYIIGAETTIKNSTISGNEVTGVAHNGGGVFVGGGSSSDVTVINTTITGNRAANSGGGIHDATSGTIIMHNSLVAGNTAGSQREISGEISTGSNNLISDPESSGGFEDGVDGNIVGLAGQALDAASILDLSLSDNGGMTRTHALLAGSSAVNAASNNEAASVGLVVDQRGESRIFGGTVDIGAYELQLPLYDLSLSGAIIPEDISNGDTVGTVTLSGVAPASYTFSLLNNSAGRFQIDSATGIVSVADDTSVDFETAEIHHIVVQVIDGLADNFARVFEIRVTDVDDPIEDLELSHKYISDQFENGDSVGVVSITDDDPVAPHHFQLLDDASGRFNIDAVTGLITIEDAALIDSTVNGSHSVHVKVTDDAGFQFEKTFAIFVLTSANHIVDVDVDENDGDFTSGDLSLREAIWLAEKTMGEQSITFDSTVFAGGGTIVLGGAELNITEDLVIHGLAGNLIAVSGDNLSRVFDIKGATVELADFTIMSGRNGSGNGGGISAENSSLHIRSMYINQNVANAGGGVYVSDGTLSIVDTTFLENRTVSSGAVGRGGGVYVIRTQANIRGTEFRLNGTLGSGLGGGIRITDGSDVTISDSLFTENGALYAGGISATGVGSRIVISNSEISHNAARIQGGGIGSNTAEVWIFDSTISHNSTTRDGGGGIRISNASFQIVNTTISYNESAGAGGGIFLFGDESSEIINTTITGNTAAEGGGIRISNSVNDLLALKNTIVAGNFADLDYSDIGGTVYGSYHNLIGDAASSGGLTDGVNDNIVGVGGVGIRDINTILDTTLRDNGGFTKTHALMNGSAAIGAGDVSLLPADTPDIDGDLDISESLPLDQNGRDRVIGSLDIGAVEHVDLGLRLFSENHLSFMENSTDAVVQIDAGSVNSSELTYQIIGGADQSLFSVNGAEVFFVSPPDYETPLDHNGNNVYQVKVSVSDGVIIRNQMLYINVLNNGAPIITSAGRGHITENATGPVYTVVGSDPEGDSLTYSIEGGQDQGLFSINGSGEIRFVTPPDYETPLDHNGNNIYIVKIGVSDGENLKTKTIYIDVYNNRMPVITSPARGNIVENDTAAVYTVAGTDPDGDTLSYTIEGGHDASLFSINGSGEIRFVTLPDYETPLDHNGNNIYIVKIGVSDGENLKTKTIYIDVYNNRMPVITSPARGGITENLSGVAYSLTATDLDDEEADLVYSIEGGQDASLFTMDIDGNISFISAPDFESPLDHNGNNVYIVKVGVSDGENLKTKTIYIDVYNAAG